MDVAEDAHGTGEATLVGTLLEDLLGVQGVLERVAETPVDQLGMRELEQNEAVDRLAPAGNRLHAGLEHVDRLVVPPRERKRPA